MKEKVSITPTIIMPSRVPEVFKLQPTIDNCGAYCLHAILKSYNIQNLPENPEDLLPDEVRKQGTTTDKTLFPRLLMNFGIYAELHSAEDLEDKEKVKLITRLLGNDSPIMCIVNKYSYAHWETIWGIEEEKKLIYLHDPSKLIKVKKLPIGNKRSTIDDFIKSWKGPDSITRQGFQHYSYIQIGSQI